MTRSRYVSTNLTPDAYGAVRKLGLEQSLTRGRRVTMSEIVAALAKLAELHPDQFGQLITESREDSTDD